MPQQRPMDALLRSLEAHVVEYSHLAEHALVQEELELRPHELRHVAQKCVFVLGKAVGVGDLQILDYAQNDGRREAVGAAGR